MRLDWERIWADFEDWYQKSSKNETCKKCLHNSFEEPAWHDQQSAIQRIVKKAIRDREAL